MTTLVDADSDQGLPEADVSSGRRGPSMVWLVPLVAVIVGAWLVYKTLSEQGPTITILFETAEGIEAGKTRIKYLNVDLGVVKSMRLSKDDSRVELKAELVLGSESKLSDTTRFWVVRPRIEGTRVSGIGTLLGGAYIGMDPGEGGEARWEFDGLEEPPKLLSHRQGSLYHLHAPRLGSVSIGSPVYYRQFKVGDVISADMAGDHSRVDIEIFVDSPHDKYVRRTSRFWNASGIELNATSEGVNLDMESLASLVQGGIAFETPEAIGGGEQAPEGNVFPLYQDQKESRERPIVIQVPYLAYFDDTVRGLTVGAPVEFRGIRIGTVKDIRIKRDRTAGKIQIGVLFGIEPERLEFDNGESSDAGTQAELEMARKLVAGGLRAQLVTGNLLTGQLFVNLDFFPDAERSEITMEDGYPVLPTVSGTLKGITRSLSNILAKLERLPIEELGRNLEETAAGVNRLVNSGELQSAMTKLDTALAKADALLGNVNQRAGPLLESATRVSTGTEALVKEATAAAAQTEKTVAAFEDVTAEDGPVGSELQRTLKELAGAARAIRIMAEYLERHPEALLKGKNSP